MDRTMVRRHWRAQAPRAQRIRQDGAGLSETHRGNATTSHRHADQGGPWKRNRRRASSTVAAPHRIAAAPGFGHPAHNGGHLDADFHEVDAAVSAARIRRTQHDELAKRLKKVRSDLATTTDALREAEASLTSLAAQAGVVGIEHIAPAVQRANERVLAARQVEEQEKALAQNTRGQPLEAFVAAALMHSDRLDQDIDSLDRRAQQLDPDITAAEAEALRAEQVLNAYQQASDSAAEARQQAELIVGRLEEHVIEYAALHLARVALDRAKERYRARRQDSLLDRAGEYFKTL